MENFDAGWWLGPDMVEAIDERTTGFQSNGNHVVFQTINEEAHNNMREEIQEHVLNNDCSWYLNKLQDIEGEITIFRYKPAMEDHSLVIDKDEDVEGVRRLVIRGICSMIIDTDLDIDGTGLNFIQEIQPLPREHSYTVESGIYFWFEVLPRLAKLTNVGLEDLQYRVATSGIMMGLEYK